MNFHPFHSEFKFERDVIKTTGKYLKAFKFCNIRMGRVIYESRQISKEPGFHSTKFARAGTHRTSSLHPYSTSLQ
jgi:hypothetical protein